MVAVVTCYQVSECMLEVSQCGRAQALQSTTEQCHAFLASLAMVHVLLLSSM